MILILLISIYCLIKLHKSDFDNLCNVKKVMQLNFISFIYIFITPLSIFIKLTFHLVSRIGKLIINIFFYIMNSKISKFLFIFSICIIYFILCYSNILYALPVEDEASNSCFRSIFKWFDCCKQSNTSSNFSSYNISYHNDTLNKVDIINNINHNNSIASNEILISSNTHSKIPPPLHNLFSVPPFSPRFEEIDLKHFVSNRTKGENFISSKF